MKRVLRKTAWLVMAALVATTALAAFGCAQKSATQPEPAPIEGDLVARFIDVGNGDCTLITCNGKSMLVDGGSSGESSKVYAILKNLGIKRLDYIIVTHPDADHAGGVSGALNAATCGTCYCSTTQSDTKTFASLKKYLDQQGVVIEVPKAGHSFDLGGATITIVGPTRDFGGDENNGSLVLRVDYGKTSFLLAADAEIEAEQAMMEAKAHLDADVLKVAHHGSDSSSSPKFLEAVSPDIAVVSVGENRYGHPDQSVISSLEALGSEVHRTDQDGSLIIISDGSNLTAEITKGNITK